MGIHRINKLASNLSFGPHTFSQQPVWFHLRLDRLAEVAIHSCKLLANQGQHPFTMRNLGLRFTILCCQDYRVAVALKAWVRPHWQAGHFGLG